MSEISILRDYARMCDALIKNCEQCKLNGEPYYDRCQKNISENPKKAVKIIKEWAKENSLKTRQSEMLKMFPMTKLDEEGVIAIDPCYINKDLRCKELNCKTCRTIFWGTEVE